MNTIPETDDEAAVATDLEGVRVAILVQNLPVPFDRRVWQEATTLRAAGAQVVVVCPSDEAHPAGDFTIDDVEVRRYRAPREASGVLGYANEYGVSLSRMRREFRRACREAPFDIIHFCNPPDLLYLVAKPAKKRTGSILVFDQHDLGPELVDAKSMPLRPLFRAVAAFFEKQTYRWADHVIATNESYRQIAMTRGGKNPEQATVIRSGPRRAWADGVEREDRWRRGHELLIGYVGVMGRQEGIEYLVDAVEILVREHRLDVQLALIGSGPDRERLESLVRKKGLSTWIEFHGRLSDDELKSALMSSDVCVNPDEVNPMNDLSTMNKIIEYMALRRPIVQFDVREGRVSAGEASIYAEKDNDARSFAEAIRVLLMDRARAEAMGEFGRQRFIDELCWESQGARLVSTYERLTRARRGGSKTHE